MIRENAGPAKEMLAVTITRDDQVEWTYQMASWRPLAVGQGCGSAYLWTARDLVILPGDPGEDPVALSVDEDLLVVFRTAAGWVLVCETSVRVGAGNPVTLGDLGILADQTAESVPADDPDVCA